MKSSEHEWKQRTLPVGGSITLWLVSSLTGLVSTDSLHKHKYFLFLVKPSLVKLETSRTVILPPTGSILWLKDIRQGFIL